MPWKETDVMKEKIKFVAACNDEAEGRTMTELCQAYGISRKTGYKILQRFSEEGVRGLEGRSRAPVNRPNKTNPELVSLIIEAKLKYGWGARKLRKVLQKRHPEIAHLAWPARSTIGDILKRNGLVNKRKKRRSVVPSSHPLSHATRPNSVWCADHKGWFRTGDGKRCEPLTITDAWSRFIVSIDSLSSTRTSEAWPVFERAFRQYGLPFAILTDNGPPFATRALGGLSRLSIWWIKLGIIPERIEPGKPEQNGRHERMHKTMKGDVPIKKNMAAQQRAYVHFVHQFNTIRPHEALADAPPASIYTHSERLYPKKLPEIVYPDGFETRKVRQNGEIKWRGNLIYASEVLVGEPIGLLPISERHIKVYFSFLPIGILDNEKGVIERLAPQDLEKKKS